MKKKVFGHTIVLSVSIMTGCYRHIRIPLSMTLEDLAEEILYAFEFDNDHLYAFFMDGKAWSSANAYYCRESSENEGNPYACDVTLYSFGLGKGDSFLFLFDFGDEWRFKCKVLRVTDEDTQCVQVMKSVGDAPLQYPDPDEDW